MLFCDYLAVVEGSPPRVSKRQPTEDRKSLPFPIGVCAFAVSSGTPRHRPREHTAALTMTDGSRVYVASLTVYARRGNSWDTRALCALSRRPLLRQLLAALRALHTAWCHGPEAASRAARTLLMLPVPLPGVVLQTRLGGLPLQLSAARVGSPPTLGVSLHDFVRRVGVEVAIGAAEVLVSELRLAMISRNEHALGVCAEALLATLYPLEWAHTYIPLLPREWRACVEAPCPFLIGVVAGGGRGAADGMGGAVDGDGAGAATDTDDGEGDDVCSILPPDVCVLDLDAGTLHVPADEPLERLPPLERGVLSEELHAWQAARAPPAARASRSAAPCDSHEGIGAHDCDGVGDHVESRSSSEDEEPLGEMADGTGVDAAAQRAWLATWRLVLSGYTSHLIDSGADVDATRLLDTVPLQRRPFLRQLLASAAFHRHLERVAMGEIVDELSGGSASATPPPPLAVLSLPDGLCTEAADAATEAADAATEAAEAATEFRREPSALHRASLVSLLEWEAVASADEPSSSTGTGTGTGTTDAVGTETSICTQPSHEALLMATAAAAAASMSSVPLQLMHAAELVRVGLPTEALSFLEATQQRVRRLQRASSSSSSLSASPRSDPRVARSGRMLATSNATTPVSERERARHPMALGGGSPAVDALGSSERLLDAAGLAARGERLALRAVVRSALSQLDARHLAELATLRSPSSSRLVRRGFSSSSRQAAGQRSGLAETTDVETTDATDVADVAANLTLADAAHSELAEPGAAAATIRAEATQSTWRDKLGQTLRAAATAAAVRQAGMLPPVPHAPQAQSPRPSSGLSPQRQPLLAVWARAYLDEQAAAEAACTSDSAEAAAEADRFGAALDDDDHDGGGDGIVRNMRSFGGGDCGALFARQDSTSVADGPPQGWGLAIPWPWSIGSDTTGRRQHIAVEPVQLFSQLHARAAENAPASTLDAGGYAANQAPPELAAARCITWTDFETFGGELLQVSGVPELPKLWSCLMAAQKRTFDAAVPPRPTTASETPDSAMVLSPQPPEPSIPPDDATLRLSIFESWHSVLCGTLHPSTSWRRRLGLEAREMLLKRTHRPAVRNEPLGVPGILALTSERLLFGSLRFQTAASLPALRSVRKAEGLLGEALLHLGIEGPKAAPLLLRFGRGRSARAQRDAWLDSIELMRRAYAHAYALASDSPVTCAGHCVACAAALPDEVDATPLLQLLSAQPPRSTARGPCALESDSRQWQLLRLTGDTGMMPSLRVSCIAAAGSGLAVATLGAELILYRVRISRHGGDASTPPCISTPPPSPVTPGQRSDRHLPPGISLCGDIAAPALDDDGCPRPNIGTAADEPDTHCAVSPLQPPTPPSTPMAARAATGPQVIATELSRARCTQPATTLAFAAAVGCSARLVSLAAEVRVWSSRLHSFSELSLPEAHRHTHIAVATQRDGGSVLAAASECATNLFSPRAIRVFRLSGPRGNTPLAARSLLLPTPILAIAFCGERYLCVAHPNEYVLLSLISGGVRELFSFVPDHGAPFLRRLSPAEVVLVQPPPRSGERHLGLFLDHNGNVARRSTAYWRQPPLTCLARGRTHVTLLSNAIEVEHPSREPRQQSLPFPDARCADDGGDLMLFANCDAVYALLPPRSSDASLDRGDSGEIQFDAEADPDV